MKIDRLVAPYLESNTFILTNGNHVLIVDCGVYLEDVKQIIAGKKVDGILLTHGHFDHSRFCNDYAKAFSCKIYASDKITQTMSDSEALYAEDGRVFDDFSSFAFIEEDKKLKIGSFDVECYYCPGHSLCSMCYKIGSTLFAGDVLFDRSIGRTDLKFSDKKMMYNSLCKLDQITFDNVCSGHGENSTFNEQKKNIAVYKRYLTR